MRLCDGKWSEIGLTSFTVEVKGEPELIFDEIDSLNKVYLGIMKH